MSTPAPPLASDTSPASSPTSKRRDRHGRGRIPEKIQREEVVHDLTLAEQNVVVARKPAEAIPGGLAGPGLLAQVLVSKGTDHLPLHRLEGTFERQGMRGHRRAAMVAADTGAASAP